MALKLTKKIREKASVNAMLIMGLCHVADYCHNRVRLMFNDYRDNGKLVDQANGFHFIGENGVSVIFNLRQIEELRINQFFGRITVKLVDVDDMFTNIGG